MRLFSGKSAKDLGIPAYTNWDDFIVDDQDPEGDGDNGQLHEVYGNLVPKDKLEAHKKEQ